MRELFEQVLQLQDQFTSENTVAMVTRGKLIRQDIPEEMLGWAATHVGAASPYEGRLATEGSDGMGRKTYVPWARIFAPEYSSSAQRGWYVVWLFRADGAGVYLCISHGSSQFDGMSFIRRPLAEMAPLLDWARDLLAEEADRRGFSGETIDVATTVGVGAMYPGTTIYNKFYPRGAVPNDTILAQDALDAIGLVGILYRAIETGRMPGVENVEVRDAELAVEQFVRPLANKQGQGFGLTYEQRCAVEKHAMAKALEWLRANGYHDIHDVSVGSSHDYTAARNGRKHIVEVKGTTGGLGTINLTKNEVEAHREAYPDNILIVVSGVDLDRNTCAATGGELTAFEGWDIEECLLTPMSYRCALVI